MPRTALIVPVREAAAYYDDVQAGSPGIPAHVTVLFPFLDGVDVDEAALHDLFARFHAFEFVLDRLERFEGGVPWLHPDPSAPFVDLTAAVWERWPSHAPYEGAFDEVIPHLTVTREDVQLPIRCLANSVWLMQDDDRRRWSTRLEIPLAG